jgi:hypothetical protein
MPKGVAQKPENVVVVVEGRLETATAKMKKYKITTMTATTAPTIAAMMAHFLALSEAAWASAYRP